MHESTKQLSFGSGVERVLNTSTVEGDSLTSVLASPAPLPKGLFSLRTHFLAGSVLFVKVASFIVRSSNREKYKKVKYKLPPALHPGLTVVIPLMDVLLDTSLYLCTLIDVCIDKNDHIEVLFYSLYFFTK